MIRVVFIFLSMLLLDACTIFCIRSAFPLIYTRYRKQFLAWYFFLHLALIAGVLLGLFSVTPRLLRTVSFVGLFMLYFSKIFTLLAVLPLLAIRGIKKLRTESARLPLVVNTTVRTLMPDTQTALLQHTVPAALLEPGLTRSAFIARSGLVLASLPLISLTAGMVSGVYDYRVHRVKLVLPRLPSAFEGLTIAQISDIHSGSFYNKRAVSGGIDLLLSLKADVIFFTGDLVNDRINEMRDYQDIFSRVKAPLGVFSSLGNHDYGDYVSWPTPAAKAQNLDELKKVHKLMGYDLLLNEHRRLKIGRDEIGILGVENWGALSHFPKYGRVDLAMKDTEELPVKLLLSHDPSHWQAQVIPRFPEIDAMFSGHTHGMQMGIRAAGFQWSPIQYVYPEWAGLYRHGHQQLYVNVGYGFLGYPGRVGILPEITLFTLSAKS